MNEPVENKPAELSQEETKEVVGGATAIMYQAPAASVSLAIIGEAAGIKTKLGSITPDANLKAAR